jgi:hypothetical protein
MNSNQGNQKLRSRVHNWKNADIDELYVFFPVQMLMGAIQKPAIKLYFSKNPLLDTPIFYKTMLQGRFELLMRFLHFANNDVIETYQGNKIIQN